ncbi:MAG: phospholipase [Paludibacteraceae bacterium]|nr:phospholipase [Paludibacteraceae bacterium]MBQ2065686.1 phospholipase [Paludibacteraceae bacterium]
MRTVVLLIIFVVTGIVIYLLRRFTGKNSNADKDVSEPTPTVMEESECCGAHEICEKTGKYNPKFQPDYYDDEELDQFKGVSPDSYTDEQIAMFDEVLMTMKESDVAGWIKSLQLREIEMPYSVREKAIMILG